MGGSSIRASDQILVDDSSALFISVLEPPSVELYGQRVHFPTRHAELAVYLLALSGEEGLFDDYLGRWLWPKAPEGRWRPRLRTLLWQVREAFDDQAWRVQRRGPVLALDLKDALVVASADSERAARGQVEIVGDAVLPSTALNRLAKFKRERALSRTR